MANGKGPPHSPSYYSLPCPRHRLLKRGRGPGDPSRRPEAAASVHQSRASSYLPGSLPRPYGILRGWVSWWGGPASGGCRLPGFGFSREGAPPVSGVPCSDRLTGDGRAGGQGLGLGSALPAAGSCAAQALPVLVGSPVLWGAGTGLSFLSRKTVSPPSRRPGDTPEKLRLGAGVAGDIPRDQVGLASAPCWLAGGPQLTSACSCRPRASCCTRSSSRSALQSCSCSRLLSASF